MYHYKTRNHMNKNILMIFTCIYLLLLSCVIVDASSCENNSDWTIIMYIALDDERMQKFLSYEIMKLQTVGSSEDVNIVAQVDRYGSYSADPYANWPDSRRFYIEKAEGNTSAGDFKISKNGLSEIIKRNLNNDMKQDDLDQLAMQHYINEILYSNPLPGRATPTGIQQTSCTRLGETNTGNPNTLVDFVTWAAEEYPANHYMLVLLGHGGGWTFYGSDSSELDHDSLSMKELDQALVKITNSTEIEKFDVIVWHACMMGQLEVMTTIAPYANYAVASEENLLAPGWNYITALKTLQENSDITGLELGRILVESTLEYYNDREFGRRDSMGTFYLLDLSQTDVVVAALNNFSETVAVDSKDELVAISKSRNNVYTFSYGSDLLSSVDLIHFMKMFMILSSDEDAQQAAKEVIGATSKMVVYGCSNDCATHAHGLSIYFPSNKANYEILYPVQAPCMEGWRKFLDNQHSSIAECCDVENLDINMWLLFDDKSYNLHNPPIVMFNYNGTSIENLELSLYRLNPSTKLVKIFQYPITLKEIYELDDEWITIESIPDGPRECEWINLNIPASSYTLSDGNLKVPAVLESTTMNRNQGVIKGVYYPKDGSPVHAMIVVDRIQKEASSIWTSQNASIGQVMHEITPKKGDKFQTLAYEKLIYLMDDRTGNPNILGENLTFGDEAFVLERAALPKGTYYLSLELSDLSGNKKRITSAPIKIDNTGINESFVRFIAPTLGTGFLIPTEWDVKDFAIEHDKRELALIKDHNQVGGVIAFKAGDSIDNDLDNATDLLGCTEFVNLSACSHPLERTCFEAIFVPKLDDNPTKFKVLLVHKPVQDLSYVFFVSKSLNEDFNLMTESVKFFELVDEKYNISIESKLDIEKIITMDDPLALVRT